MEVIHRILGYLAVVVVVIGIVWSFVMTRRPLLGRTRFHRFQTLVVALVVVTGVAGLGVLVMGGQPKEGLHLVYAVVAVAAIPLAAWFVPAPDRRAGLVALAVFVVLGFILYRLFATG